MPHGPVAPIPPKVPALASHLQAALARTAPAGRSPTPASAQAKLAPAAPAQQPPAAHVQAALARHAAPNAPRPVLQAKAPPAAGAPGALAVHVQKALGSPAAVTQCKPRVDVIQRSDINISKSTVEAGEILGIEVIPSDNPHKKKGTGRGQSGVESHQDRNKRSVKRENKKVRNLIKKKTGASLSPKSFVKMKKKEEIVEHQKEELVELISIKNESRRLKEEQKTSSLFTYLLHQINLNDLKSFDRQCVTEFLEKHSAGKKPKGYSEDLLSDTDLIAEAVTFAKQDIGAL
jgi:hypothetical protein